jgi:hypothetical protein
MNDIKRFIHNDVTCNVVEVINKCRTLISLYNIILHKSPILRYNLLTRIFLISFFIVLLLFCTVPYRTARTEHSEIPKQRGYSKVEIIS